MAAVGVLTAGVAFRLSAKINVDWRELVLLGSAAALSAGTMSAVNFALGSDFRFLLVVPALAWISAIILSSFAASRTGPNR